MKSFLTVQGFVMSISKYHILHIYLITWSLVLVTQVLSTRYHRSIMFIVYSVNAAQNQYKSFDDSCTWASRPENRDNKKQLVNQLGCFKWCSNSKQQRTENLSRFGRNIKHTQKSAFVIDISLLKHCWCRTFCGLGLCCVGCWSQLRNARATLIKWKVEWNSFSVNENRNLPKTLERRENVCMIQLTNDHIPILWFLF